MSRSNPNESTPNPSTRWFEWNGEHGTVRYYDRDKQQRIDVGADFGFVLLDELASVGGFHEPSQSRIYANEVRDTRTDLMIVRAFKGGTLVEGLYRDIKHHVHALKGYFVTNLYIAFKGDEGGLQIGSLRMKGAALSAWMDFRKAHRADIYRKAIRINGYTEGKKGRITYRMPVFQVAELSEASNATAKRLDEDLQVYLLGYLRKTTTDQVESAKQQVPDDVDPPYDEEPMAPMTESDIPFAWLLPLVLPVLGLLGASQVLA